jgi:hypothetical protein
MRVGIQQIILPVDRGGLNLMNPGIKVKTLFIKNFLKHSTNNPFIMQFLPTNNPPFLHSMPNISYVKFFLLEISYIPNEQITNPIKSTNLYYQYYLSNLPEKAPNVPITRANWRTIWRYIASKIPNTYHLVQDLFGMFLQTINYPCVKRYTDKEGWIHLIALNVQDKTKL